MHNHKKNGVLGIIPRFLLTILPFFFWVFIMFALDSPYAAFSTLIGCAVHETAHTCVFIMLGRRASLPTPRLSGFRIYGKGILPYKDEITVALAGPVSNLILSALALPLMLLDKEAYFIFATVNLAECISNLLPVNGYDGYKALRAYAMISEKPDRFINIIEAFSFLFIALMCFLSLYLIARLGEGYWIFLIFFLSLVTEGRKSRLLSRERD